MSDTGKWRAADYVPDGVSTVMLVMLLFACWVSYRNAPPVPVAFVAPAEPVRDGDSWALEVVEFENGTRRSRASGPEHAAALADLVERLGDDEGTLVGTKEKE